MLKRIKYVSHFARPLTAEEIDELGVECERYNLESGITGVLMASGGLFFQILEGPEGAVDETWERIREDPRHKDVLLLNSESKVERRLYPDWAMKTISLEASRAERLAPLRALLETIAVQRGLIDKLVHTIERSLWQELTFGSARSESSETTSI